MFITPRLMVIDTIVTDLNKKIKHVDVHLLDRKTSADIKKRFPKYVPGNKETTTILDYARENSQEFIGKPGISLPHQRRHSIVLRKAADYRIGEILTEKEAYEELGYPEPYIDTLCANMGTFVNHNITSLDTKFVTTEFFKAKYITNSQKVFVDNFYPGRGFPFRLDVVEKAHVVELHQGIIKGVSEKRPVSLIIYNLEDKHLPIGCSYFVPENNTVYEFMTYPPLKNE